MYVSSGDKQVAVPPLVGLTLGAAAQRIAAKGLEYNSTEEESDRPRRGHLPVAGCRHRSRPGRPPSVWLSLRAGDASVTVPSVVGKTESERKRR